MASKFALPGNAHGIAIAHDGTMLITRFDSGDVVTARVGDFAFGPFIHVGPEPVDVAITPDGRTAFVAMLDNPHVAIVDVRSLTQVGMLAVAPSALRVLVTPDGNRVYITTTGSLSDTGSAVYDYDVHSHALIDTMLVGPQVNGITYDSARARLYVSSGSSVYEIDAVNDVVLRRIPVAGQSQDVAVTPDGSQLWVATEGDAGVQVVDLASGSVLQSVAGTSAAFGLAITPDGQQLYVTRNSVDMCAIIDRASHTVVKSFAIGVSPQRIAFDVAGTRAVITDGETGAVLIQ